MPLRTFVYATAAPSGKGKHLSSPVARTVFQVQRRPPEKPRGHDLLVQARGDGCHHRSRAGFRERTQNITEQFQYQIFLHAWYPCQQRREVGGDGWAGDYWQGQLARPARWMTAILICSADSLDTAGRNDIVRFAKGGICLRRGYLYIVRRKVFT